MDFPTSSLRAPPAGGCAVLTHTLTPVLLPPSTPTQRLADANNKVSSRTTFLEQLSREVEGMNSLANKMGAAQASAEKDAQDLVKIFCEETTRLRSEFKSLVDVTLLASTPKDHEIF